MLKKLGVVSSNEEIMDAFNLFDSNDDGKISPDEFEADIPLPRGCDVLIIIMRAREDRSIPFEKFDKNNDGFISKSEFKRKIKRMLKKLGVVSSNEEIMDAFNLFDSNGDGKISPDEFEADVPLPKKANCLIVVIIRQK